MFRENTPLNSLVGRNINEIRMDSEFLVFRTDDGTYSFTVEGDCCSSSYFYDFYGVQNLLNNGPVLKVENVDLDVDEIEEDYGEVIQVYGYRFTTEHPTWGEVSSVVSFRNSSNGYYGGWMEAVNVSDSVIDRLPVITDDVIEVED